MGAGRRSGSGRVRGLMGYWTHALVLGLAWGLAGFLLGRSPIGSIVWGGVLASPLIGLSVGLVARPFLRVRPLGLALLALVDLQLAAALFGLAIGVYDALVRDIPGRNAEVLWQGVPAVLWGLNLTGYVLFLWPLSYWSHRWLFAAPNRST